MAVQVKSFTLVKRYAERYPEVLPQVLLLWVLKPLTR